MDTEGGGRYIGSFGRNTANSWISDIDMLFEMPLSSYNTYNNYNGNGQSALLQAVKIQFLKLIHQQVLREYGQIVLVKFTDNMEIEVLPAWKNKDDSYTYAGIQTEEEVGKLQIRFLKSMQLRQETYSQIITYVTCVE